MRLDTIKNRESMIDRLPIDLDAASRIGPSIHGHMSGIESLVRLLPNHVELLAKLNELKELVSACLPAMGNVLENDSSPRIYDYDPGKPFGQQMARTGAGAERIGYLPIKLINEAGRLEELVEDVDSIEKMAKDGTNGMGKDDVIGAIDALLHFNAQVNNTLRTFTEAVSEVRMMHASPGRQVMEDLSYVDASVDKLEGRLSSMAKNGSTLDYQSIDEVMKQICREDGCSSSDLHERFKEKHGGKIPDDWANELREAPTEMSFRIQEMYESMKPRVGPDRIWSVISKALRAEGHARDIVDAALDDAINRIDR